MGEIADMVLEGLLCQGCGVYLEGASGFPRSCGACGGEVTRGQPENEDPEKDWSKEPPISLLSRATLTKLADAHLREFTQKLAAAKAGARGYRLDECESYFYLWRAETSRLMHLEPPPMNGYTFNEYQDALFSGDYDDVLTEQEFAALQRYAAETG